MIGSAGGVTFSATNNNTHSDGRGRSDSFTLNDIPDLPGGPGPVPQAYTVGFESSRRGGVSDAQAAGKPLRGSPGKDTLKARMSLMRRELMDETDKGGIDFEKLKEIDQKRQAGILKQIYFVVEEPENSRLGSAISSFVMVLIILSIFALVGRDWPPARDNVPPKVWEITEYVCTTVFTIEYLVRLAVCTEASEKMTRMKFVFAPSNLCDILAILPSYIEFIPTNGDKPVYLRVLRVIRLSRILRLFKVMRNSPHMRVLQEGLRRSVQPLILLVILIFFGMIFFSSLMYYAERNYCNWSELDAICQLGPDCAWQFSDPCPWNTSVNGFGLRSVYQLPRATQDRNVCEVAVALLPELGEVPAECTDEARSALAAQACAVGVALDDAAALSGTEDYNLYQRDPDLASQTAWSRRNAAYERWNAFQVACAVGLGPLSYKSIGSTFWWTITSMTVVGYGDVYPQTLQGKLVGMMTLAFAPLLLALPMSIIVNQFQTVYNELQSRAPVNVSKLPLSSRLRAQLRTRWQARMELSESGLKKKEVIPGSPVKSGRSPSPRPKSRQSPGNSSPSIAGRLVPGSNAEDGDDRADLTPPHSPSSRDDGKRPSLQLTVDDYKDDGEDCEQNPLLARVSVIEAKVDQAYELTTRALEVMRAAVALAAEGGEKARELQLATDATARFEKGGAAKASTVHAIPGAVSRPPVVVSRSSSANANAGPAIPLVGDPPPPENHGGQPSPDQKDLGPVKESEGLTSRETQWSL